MRSSNNALKFFLAVELGCPSLGLMLDIIAFLPCLTREDCSFLRLLLLISNLNVPLINISSFASASRRSEVLWGFPIPSSSKSSLCSPSPHDGGVQVGLAFASFPRRNRLLSCTPPQPQRFALHHHLDSSHFLVPFCSLKDHYDPHSLLHKQKHRRCC